MPQLPMIPHEKGLKDRESHKTKGNSHLMFFDNYERETSQNVGQNFILF
jgi:hypothetical protein